MSNLAVPKDLGDAGRRAYAIITAYLQEHDCADTGGCKAFYSPAEWSARNEAYGTKSHLVVVHGGAMRSVFSMDAAYDLDCAVYEETGQPHAPYSLYDGMQAKLRAAGLYFEECTRGYCAIYSVEGA
jgi:hypothetical protein